jgi:diguanylate cyclase (GGDEF)-like protein
MQISNPKLSSSLILNHHILVIETQESQQIIYLNQEHYTLGRKTDNSIVINSNKVSRHHATLMRRMDTNSKDYSFWIIDGDLEGNRSHNGIFVNQQREFVHKLSSGDIIHLTPEIKISYHVIYNSPESFINAQNSSHPPIHYVTQKNELDKQTLIANFQENNGLENDLIHNNVNQLTHRGLFIHYLNYSLNNAIRQKHLLALALLEIPEFSSLFPDSHYLKSNLLAQISRKLKSTLRQGDFIYYWQEGQFMILMPYLKEADNLIKLAPRILKIFEQPFEIENQSFKLNVSLGLTLYPEDGLDSKTLIQNAQTALNKVNKASTIACGFYNPKMDKKHQFVLRLDELIKQALIQNQFLLCYQPQINLITQNIESFEALLRWQHPTLGLLSPANFLPLAEKGNSLIYLAQWVLQTIAEQSLNCQQQGGDLIPITLNLSSQQFYHPDLLKMIRYTLKRRKVNPTLLGFEISEETLMKDIEKSTHILNQLNELGIVCIVDDFKGNQLSLQHLEDLPIQTLKISQSLIERLTTHPQKTGVLSAIFTLENHFGFTVVAKGVETPEQFNLLRQLNCYHIQGHFGSPPLPVEDMIQSLNLRDKNTRTLGQDNLLTVLQN